MLRQALPCELRWDQIDLSAGLIRPRFAAAVASVSTSAGVKCKPCRAVIRIVSASRWPYHLARKKNGVPSTHPLKGDEIRALRQLRRDWPDGRFVFVTERGTPFTRSGLSKMVEAAGKEAKFDFPVHSICCVMPAAITTRTVVRTRERFSSGLDINRYSTPCGTRS